MQSLQAASTPLVDRFKLALATLAAQREMVANEMPLWEASALSKGVTNFTCDDMIMLCCRQAITFDPKTIKENNADGKRLPRIRDAGALRRFTGVTAFGDAAHLLSVLHALATERRFLPPRSTEPATDNQPQHWNVTQTGEWLQRCGLADLQPVFATHKIAGDVLLTMDLDSLAAVEDSVLDRIEELTAAIGGLRGQPLVSSNPFMGGFQAHPGPGLTSLTSAFGSSTLGAPTAPTATAAPTAPVPTFATASSAAQAPHSFLISTDD
eukprot:m.829390 g.829390  ORF g.829390 m.829390 type:complete len:267 (-) comp59447_c1_seq9:104-904(-)